MSSGNNNPSSNPTPAGGGAAGFPSSTSSPAPPFGAPARGPLPPPPGASQGGFFPATGNSPATSSSNRNNNLFTTQGVAGAQTREAGAGEQQHSDNSQSSEAPNANNNPNNSPLGRWLNAFPNAGGGTAAAANNEMAERALRQNHYSIRLRICCEVLLFLGCIHLGIFPDWWNGVTNIGIAILLSTSLFRRASISTLVSVVLLSFLNALVQMIALLSLLKLELFDKEEAPDQQVLFIAYILLIFCDTVTMLVTGNASAMLLRDVLQIILRQEQSNDLENPLLQGAEVPKVQWIQRCSARATPCNLSPGGLSNWTNRTGRAGGCEQRVGEVSRGRSVAGFHNRLLSSASSSSSTHY
ncbi:unnamed protein product [Amoebophrya sp. A120]|nr:unnamed protein product [Amoebophrya sp. A120]|eukprot:GSA120T00014136001.1